MRNAMAVVALVLSLVAPAVAWAQGGPVDVSIAYTVTARSSREPLPIPGRDPLAATFHGWSATISQRLGRVFAVTGEVSGAYRRENVLASDDDLTVALTSFVAGPRIIAGVVPRVSVFGQFLIGLEHTRIRFDGGIDFNNLVLQPGGGVDVGVGDRVGARMAVEYRRTIDDWPLTQTRVLAGLVFSP